MNPTIQYREEESEWYYSPDGIDFEPMPQAYAYFDAWKVAIDAGRLLGVDPGSFKIKKNGDTPEYLNGTDDQGEQ